MKQYDIKEYSLIPPPFGGVSVYLMRLVQQLNQDGIKAGAYYSCDNNDDTIKNSPLFDEFQWDENESKFSRAVSHIKRIIRASEKYEILHIHGHEVMILASLVRFFLRQKIVVTIHNAMIVETFSRFSFIKKQAFKYLAQQDIQWIAVSEQAKDNILKVPVRFRNPIIVIPAYVPDKSSPQPLSKDLSDYIKRHDKIISFYGRSFMHYKGKDVYGFRTIIKLYSKLNCLKNKSIGFILCISDISDTESILKLHQYAKELHVDDEIFWQLGAIKEIRSLWLATDLYVRPTSTDGDSVSIRDVLAEGVAVVASDVCQRPNGVITYRYGDDDELLRKCKELLFRKREKSFENESPYIKMKDIYLSILNR